MAQNTHPCRAGIELVIERDAIVACIGGYWGGTGEKRRECKSADQRECEDPAGTILRVTERRIGKKDDSAREW